MKSMSSLFLRIAMSIALIVFYFPLVSGAVVTMYMPDTLAVIEDTGMPRPEVRDTITIALLLPFQVEANAEADTATVTAPVVLKESLPALHFMESALLLRDSLRARGIMVYYKVADTGYDSLATVAFLSRGDMKGVDAVISLLPQQYTSDLSRAAMRWEKPVWFFSAPNTRLLEKNPWLRLMVPSNTTQIRLTAEYLALNHASARCITVYREQRRENDIAALFAECIDSLRIGGDSCRAFNYARGGWTGLRKKMSESQENLILVPTTDESFLSTIINDMGDDRKALSIRFCGMPSWENFHSIDQELMSELRTMFFNGLFIDGDYPPVADFRKRFMEACSADPLPSAFLAHDAILSVVRSLPGGEDATSGWPFLLSRNSNRMERVSETGGMENRTVNIIRFGEVALIRVN